MKIILRLLVTPLVFCIILITHLYHTFKRTYLFMRYGGELIGYDQDDRVMIHDIYHELKKRNLE